MHLVYFLLGKLRSKKAPWFAQGPKKVSGRAGLRDGPVVPGGRWSQPSLYYSPALYASTLGVESKNTADKATVQNLLTAQRSRPLQCGVGHSRPLPCIYRLYPYSHHRRSICFMTDLFA